jgi:hypothetical protein
MTSEGPPTMTDAEVLAGRIWVEGRRAQKGSYPS